MDSRVDDRVALLGRALQALLSHNRGGAQPSTARGAGAVKVSACAPRCGCCGPADCALMNVANAGNRGLPALPDTLTYGVITAMVNGAAHLPDDLVLQCLGAQRETMCNCCWFQELCPV